MSWLNKIIFNIFLNIKVFSIITFYLACLKCYFFDIKIHRALGIIHTKNDTGLMSQRHLSGLIETKISFRFPFEDQINKGEKMFLLSCFFHSHIASVSEIWDGSSIHGIWNLAWLRRSDRKNILSPEVSQFVLTSLTESRFGTPQSHFECYLPTIPTHKFTLPSALKYGAVRTIYSIWQGATSHLSLFLNLWFRGNEFLPLLPSCKSLALNDKSMSQRSMSNVEIICKLLH